MTKALSKKDRPTVLMFLLLLIIGLSASSASAVTIYGVTNSNQLIRFDSATPGTVTTVGQITGLQAGENILGIDFRTATGQLYALGSTSRIYVINKNNAAVITSTTLSTALNGTEFGFDFNPTVDRIRIVSDADQNLRVNPNNGSVTVDGTLNPGTPNVTAAAYTNSVFGATTTTLYVIDTGNDTLYTQNPPNNGTLVQVGPLGVDPTDTNGFDIAPNSNTAYAALTSTLVTSLYTINLSTGQATSAGLIGLGLNNLRGLAVDPELAGSPASVTVDFNGDRRTDYSVFRLSNNTFYVNTNPNNNTQFYGVQFGQAGDDILTPGDYDGDGRTDIAVWRNSTGVFYVLRSTDGGVQTYQFGLPGDEPVARDYDSDGRTDFAVVRRQGGQLVWYITNSIGNTIRIEQFGLANDVVAPGDYDGDGRFDLATYRGNGNNNSGQATFYVQRSTLGFTAVQFGLGSDVVVPGDYDGDRRTDYAVVRQGSPYTWYILRSSDNSVLIIQFGTKPHYTTQGDYDGDGRTDISVYDPTIGRFYVLQSSSNFNTTIQFNFGVNGDYPVANFDTH